jgi:hypothetical protein
VTCIVGVVQDGVVHIGGDSAGVDERYALTVRADCKVFRNGPFIMGFTSSFRMGQLLAHALKPPKRHPDEDVYAFMVTDFINAVRDCLKSGGYAEKHHEAEIGGTFLVGYEGRLFNIGPDYQVGEPVNGFDACGCGDLIAIGVLHALKDREPDPGVRVLEALKAAEQSSAGVRAPFHVISTKTPDSGKDS